MQQVTVDWAGDEQPVTGVVCNDDEVFVVVEYDAKPGPAGWPLVTVYAHALNGAPTYREAMALDAWLAEEYGEGDDEMRQELLDLGGTTT
jgi:hypothetical protein